MTGRGKFFGVLGLALMLSIGISSCNDGSGETDPIVYDWISTDDIDGMDSELSFDSDGRGEALIYAFIAVETDEGIVRPLIEFEYELEWEKSRNEEYDIELKNTGTCIVAINECFDGDNGYDFEMECEMNSRHDELECEGDNGWEDYEFEFELD